MKLGSFKGALRAEIDHFREFPDAVRRLPSSLKAEPVVMFCTGGIRCEKAGPFMEREGFRNIFQLDGGILKYFEECGDAHYDGECFVFDQRVGLDGSLRETGSVLCSEEFFNSFLHQWHACLPTHKYYIVNIFGFQVSIL